MSTWGPGILQSDAALDVQDDMSLHLGFDVVASTPAQAASHRAALEHHLPTLLANLLQPTPLDDLAVGEKLLRCLIAREPRLSPTARVAMTRVAQNFARDIPAAPEMLEYVPSYFRAVACRVLATVLMRYGCTVPSAVHRTLLDGMLNCEDVAVTLDTQHDYFPQDAELSEEMRQGLREQGRARLDAVHALHRQFNTYATAGGQAQDLAA